MKTKLFLIIVLVSLITLCISALMLHDKAFGVEAERDSFEVDPGSSLIINFNQPMIPQTVEKNIVITPPANISFDWKDDYRQLLVTVSDETAGVYQITLQGGISFAMTQAREENFFFTVAGYEEGQGTIIAQLPESKPTEKGIEINLSSQKLKTWQDGKILGTYLVSTGKPSTPTKAGAFEVLSKIPTAYGCGDGQCWTMPYWLGIYRIGAIENGIHEMPFINGWREGSSSLGHPVSHGCVRLDIGPAEKIYDWADIGMPVDIHY